MHASALRLERHQRTPRIRGPTGRDVVLRHAEGSELVLRQVDAAEHPVLPHVTNDVDQLQRNSERLGSLHVVGAVHGDAGDPDRARDLRAVAA